MTTTINKEQKNPNVPNLRFPEFEGEWKRHSLTDFMSFKNGMNPDAKRFGTGTKFISVMDILNNQYICYDNIRASVELQDGDIEAYGVNYGDILFQRSSETLEDIGRANVYLDSKPAIFGGFVIRGKSKDNYNPLFFRYLLASPTARKRIIVKGAGAQHFNIGQDGLSKVFIDIPTLKEQKKIGKLLQCLDERIATQNKIIDKLQSLIKGINQEVFNGVGYSYKLGSICEIKSGYSGNQLIKKEGLKVSRIETISRHRINLERVGYVSPFKNSESYKLQIGDILFSNINSVEYIGNTAFVDKDYDLYHGMNLLRLIPNSKIVVPFYLYLLLNTRKMLNRFKTICNKAVSQASINQADLGKTIIVLPSLENQIKICTIYEVLFSKIEAEKKCLSLYNVQKQYLLRQMFI